MNDMVYLSREILNQVEEFDTRYEWYEEAREELVELHSRAQAQEDIRRRARARIARVKRLHELKKQG